MVLGDGDEGSVTCGVQTGLYVGIVVRVMGSIADEAGGREVEVVAELDAEVIGLDSVGLEEEVPPEGVCGLGFGGDSEEVGSIFLCEKLVL